MKLVEDQKIKKLEEPELLVKDHKDEELLNIGFDTQEFH